MNLPPLPTTALIRSHGNPYAEGYTPEQMNAYGQACREQALLDAMNATKAFGVIAVMIGALK